MPQHKIADRIPFHRSIRGVSYAGPTRDAIASVELVSPPPSAADAPTPDAAPCVCHCYACGTSHDVVRDCPPDYVRRCGWCRERHDLALDCPPEVGPPDPRPRLVAPKAERNFAAFLRAGGRRATATRIARSGASSPTAKRRAET